jgi:hypothetical protein
LRPSTVYVVQNHGTPEENLTQQRNKSSIEEKEAPITANRESRRGKRPWNAPAEKRYHRRGGLFDSLTSTKSDPHLVRSPERKRSVPRTPRRAQPQEQAENRSGTDKNKRTLFDLTRKTTPDVVKGKKKWIHLKARGCLRLIMLSKQQQLEIDGNT